MVEYSYIRVRSAISKSKLPDIDYALNPYIGCEHSCVYCYGPDLCRRYQDVALNWGSKVLIKSNIVNVVRDEVKRLKKGVVGISTITDPYQPIEGRLGITREVIKILLNHGFKVSIQTKSNLVLRDLDIIDKSVDVGITITTLDDELASKLEPRAPKPSLRARTAYEIASRDIELWIFMGPLIPLINDDLKSISNVVEFASSINAYVIYDKLNVKPLTLYNLRVKWPFDEDLDVVVKLSNDVRYVKELTQKVIRACSRYGVKCLPAFKSLTT